MRSMCCVLVLLALATVVAAQGVGTLLAPAFLVGPAATAALFARRIPSMMAVASALALGAAVAGLHANIVMAGQFAESN